MWWMNPIAFQYIFDFCRHLWKMVCCVCVLVVMYQAGEMPPACGHQWARGGGEGTHTASQLTKRKFVRSTTGSGRATKCQVDSLFIYAHSAMDIINFLLLATKWQFTFRQSSCKAILIDCYCCLFDVCVYYILHHI